MKNILEININSPIFKSMLTDLDLEIKRVIEKLYKEEFEAGDISLKLSLSLPEESKVYPGKKDELDFGESEIYYFKKPYFEHKVSTSLKKQYKTDGVYTEDRELKLVDDKYVLVPVTDPQISLLDDNNFLK